MNMTGEAGNVELLQAIIYLLEFIFIVRPPQFMRTCVPGHNPGLEEGREGEDTG